jgi:hypothetical protein
MGICTSTVGVCVPNPGLQSPVEAVATVHHSSTSRSVSTSGSAGRWLSAKTLSSIIASSSATFSIDVHPNRQNVLFLV